MPSRRLAALLPLAVAALSLAPATAGAARPTPGPQVQAPPSPSSSPVFAAVSSAFRTMSRTKYQHQDLENATAGTYYFDCVGLANYFLGLGAPRANAALRAAEHVRANYVPRPDQMGAYLRGLPAAGTSLWKPVRTVAAIAPGDLIVMDAITNPDTPAFVGHALIAASAPLLLSNGSYALQVFDSTGTPHGAADSRRWDPRAVNDRPGVHQWGSGLGMGTIQLWVDGAGRPQRISWVVGIAAVATPIEIGRALG
ncbi:MAG: hypothetical protein JWQ48_3187 [Conexibacter sp.]|nr:hypothetical protein [Conexibacter sp.]